MKDIIGELALRYLCVIVCVCTVQYARAKVGQIMQKGKRKMKNSRARDDFYAQTAAVRNFSSTPLSHVYHTAVCCIHSVLGHFFIHFGVATSFFLSNRARDVDVTLLFGL